MNTRHTFLPVVAMLLLASHAPAQTASESPTSETRVREAEFAERMREAEERLAEAARRVAELSSERLGSIGSIQQFAFDFSNRPRIGVTIGSDETPKPVEGVSVIGVTPGSAAADAGLRAGDVLTSVNGESLSAESSEAANMRLFEFMKGVEEGDTLDIEYLRDGKVGKLAVEPRVNERRVFAYAGPEMHEELRAPGFPGAPEIVERFRFGGGWRGTWGDMELVEINEGLGRYFGTDKGLLVISAPKTNAFKLQEGDVIRSIDGREPSSVNHCMRILGSYQPGEKLVLNIMRDKRQEKIEVEVPDDRSSHFMPRHERPARPARAPMPDLPPRAPGAERT